MGSPGLGEISNWGHTVIEIEGSFDEQWGTVKSTVRNLEAVINGNGKGGLLKEMTETRSRLDELVAYGRATYFWAKVIAGLLGIILAYLGVRTSMKSAKVNLPDLFSRPTIQEVYAPHQLPDQQPAWLDARPDNR